MSHPFDQLMLAMLETKGGEKAFLSCLREELFDDQNEELHEPVRAYLATADKMEEDDDSPCSDKCSTVLKPLLRYLLERTSEEEKTERIRECEEMCSADVAHSSSSTPPLPSVLLQSTPVIVRSTSTHPVPTSRLTRVRERINRREKKEKVE